MDGLLGAEFALVLRDSRNSTPRRHVVSPSPPAQAPSMASPQKKPRGSDFGMTCNMQLEPRLQFAPIPTSPTSPLPNSKLIESPAPTSQTTGYTENSLGSRPSPTAKLNIVGAGESQLTPISPISKPKHRNSDQVLNTVRKNLSSSFSDSAASRLEVLATVSVVSDLQNPGLNLAAVRSGSTTTTSVGILPTSPVNSEVRSSVIGGDEKKKTKSGLTKSSRGSGKSNSNGRVFACKQCSSTFSQQFNLNKHVRAVHERRRPFECGTCHARFQQKSHRTMHHLAVHEKLRQFSCDQCNASFSWRGVLKKHRKSIHGLDD